MIRDSCSVSRNYRSKISHTLTENVVDFTFVNKAYYYEIFILYCHRVKSARVIIGVRTQNNRRKILNFN